MYCPKCGCEFREGYYKCSDCDISLVNELPKEFISQENKHGVVINIALKSLLFFQNIIRSEYFEKISYYLFVFSCFILFLSNVFRLKYNSLWVIGPGWEIPVDLVWPIQFTGRLSYILFLVSLSTGLFGFKGFLKQHRWNKLLYSLWYILTISITLIDFRRLPDGFVNFYKDYWYFGIFVFTFILILVLYYSYKTRNDYRNK